MAQRSQSSTDGEEKKKKHPVYCTEEKWRRLKALLALEGESITGWFNDQVDKKLSEEKK